MNTTPQKPPRRALSLLLSALVVALVIAGVWFVKNMDRTPSAPDAPPAEGALEIDSVDLAALHAPGLPLLLDFGAEGCGPCRMMAPALAAIHEQMRGKATVRFVDVWKHPDAAAGFPVSLIPTQAFFNADGSPFVPSEALRQRIAFSLYTAADAETHALTLHQGPLTEAEMREILREMGVSE